MNESDRLPKMSEKTVKPELNGKEKNDLIIEASGLSFMYDPDARHPDYALKDLSVSIRRGEYVAVVGRNGSGKSTFAKLLNMILEPTSGELYIDGIKIGDELTDEQLIELRRRVGMVFQNPDNQLVATVVEEDVAFGPENLGIEPAEIRRRVDGALAAVGMSEYAKHEPHRLSGGQKQRVAIAGIIAMMPECMIFDESTAMLDPSGRAEVVSLMEKLNRERGITVINITHLMSEAARADRILVINRGELIGEGTPREVFSNAALVAEAGLELPQSSLLLHALKNAGVDIDVSGITPDECADRIAASLKNRN